VYLQAISHLDFRQYFPGRNWPSYIKKYNICDALYQILSDKMFGKTFIQFCFRTLCKVWVVMDRYMHIKV
jgi:hypothetical protein